LVSSSMFSTSVSKGWNWAFGSALRRALLLPQTRFPLVFPRGGIGHLVELLGELFCFSSSMFFTSVSKGWN